ncbi:hypothetical protein [Aeromonas enteropelogenes]|uniref:hypothetical protein n=1 Tax=Aeromonas enteropelogenes TaxID=29489 RepID=UPI003BA0B59F
MNTIKFNAAQQAEGLVLPAFWAESLRQDLRRLDRLQARLACLRIVRRVSGTHDRAQARTLLQMCRLARATLCHTQTTVIHHAKATGGQA